MTALEIHSDMPFRDPHKSRIESVLADMLAHREGSWHVRIGAAASGPGWWLIKLAAEDFKWSLLVHTCQSEDDIRAALEAGLPRRRARPGERRRHPRFSVSYDVRLQWPLATRGPEGTRTDDLGPGGARVATSWLASPGESVTLEVEDAFALRASVQGVSSGLDGRYRLSLVFLDEVEAADHVWRMLDRDALA